MTIEVSRQPSADTLADAPIPADNKYHHIVATMNGQSFANQVITVTSSSDKSPPSSSPMGNEIKAFGIPTAVPMMLMVPSI